MSPCQESKKILFCLLFGLDPKPFYLFILRLRKKLNNKNLAESILLFKQATQQADIQLLDCIFQNIFLLLTEAAIKKLSLHPAGD